MKADSHIAAAVAAAIAVSSLASAARADSVGGRPDERSAIRHAESVVVGAFTGATSRRTQEQRNTIDANGRAYTARIELIAHELAVTEHLDGTPTPAAIMILVPGALALPAPRRRIVIGIHAEGSTPKDGYNLVYGHALEADTDARLAQLRDWVKDVRAPAPIEPQALAESIGLHEAEARLDEPVASGPIGSDDPDGPARPRFIGPPRTAPQVIEPLGDPRHPPEAAVAGAIAATADASTTSPSAAPAPRRAAAPATIGAASGPAPASSRTRWLFAAVATLAAVAAALRWRRAARS